MLRRISNLKGLAALMTLLLTSVLLAGCGDKADLSVFLIPEQGMPDSVTSSLEQSLQKKLGEKTVDVVGSPIYNNQKLIVEYIAGEHGILAIPKTDFQSMISEGGGEPLDSLFKPEDYPDGVLTGTILLDDNKEAKEKHLFGIPVKQAAMFKDAGFVPEDFYLIIPANTPDLELSKQALKELVNP